MIYGLYYSTFLMEALCLLASLLFWNKYRDDFALRFILPYLLIIVGTEWYHMLTHTKNLLAFNFTMPLECLFYYFLFFHHIRNPKYKKLIIGFVVIFLIAWIIDFIQIKNLQTTLVATSYSMGAIGIIITYLFYLVDLLHRNDYQRYNHDLFFWIANGVFIFLLMTILKDSATNYSAELNQQTKITIRIIQFLGSNILYLSYIIGFIVLRKKTVYQ